jgi:large subunit ribosomal protein L23
MAVIEEKKEETKETKKVTKKAATKKAVVVAAENSDIASKVLVEPWITEKTHRAIADSKYTFKVSGKATKQQVKLAVEGMYGVHVEKMNMVNNLPKKKAYGRYMGKKAGLRKATVTLKKGEKIELFQAA